jgi:vancomycin resistance protein YoaR
VTDQPTRLGDAPPDEGPPQEGPEQDGPPEEVLQDEGSPLEVSQHEGSPLEVSQHEGSPLEVSQHEGPPQEGPPQEGPPQEGMPQAVSSTGAPFWKHRWPIVAGVVIAVIGVLYLAMYVAAGRDLAHGSTVLGIDIGDLSKAEAAAKLADELPALVDEPLSVQVADDEKTYSVAPAESGLSIDIEATVEAVPGASANPVSLIRALFGSVRVDPVPSVDRPALEAAVTAIAEQANMEPINGSVAFSDGAVVTTPSTTGRSVDVGAGADAVESAYFGTSGPPELPLPTIELPTNEIEPAITDADVEEAVATFAKPAMSGSVTIRAGNQTATLTPAMVGAALTMVPDDNGVLTPALDGAALVEAAADRLGAIGRAGRDATITIGNRGPVIIPSESGLGVEPDVLAAAVLPALTASGDARTAKVELTEVEPELTTEEAGQLGVTELVSEFTTRFPHASYRNTNIGLALSRIDDTLLLPGEVFSLNDLVGERNAANGFAIGWTIDAGRLKKDYGGGVSQVATTTYHAAFQAGLADVYHQPHSIYFDRYPVGQEATVSWGDFDMSFKNDTPYGVVVNTGFTPSGNGSGTVTVQIWSTKHFRVETSVSARSNSTSPQTVYDTSPECQEESGWEGFSVTSYRKVWTSDGTLVKDESYPWTYKPNPTVICGPDPAAGDPARAGGDSGSGDAR